MLYYDPTEARANMHPKLIEYGKPLIGLEMNTGADMLITGMSASIPGLNINRSPGINLFPNHMKHAMLVQRKAGGDLIESIKAPGLSSILLRMQKWETATHWLMTVGEFKREERFVVINGRKSGFGYNAYKGAIDAWQLSGGMHHHDETEEEAADWLIRWDKHLPDIKDGNYYVRPKHTLFHLRDSLEPWRNTLESFPGVGTVLSSAIAQHCGNLKTALWWMSEESESGLAGIGVETKMKWREWLGLKDNEVLAPIDRDDPLFKPTDINILIESLEGAAEVVA